MLAQHEGYAFGRTRDFPIACDFHGITPMARAAMEAVRKVPWGQTRTYEQLAQSFPGGTAPVVRDALARNPLPLVIPCHRALGSGDMGVNRARIERWLGRLEAAVTAPPAASARPSATPPAAARGSR